MSPNRVVQLVTVALQGTPQDEAVVEALREVRERSGEALEGSGPAGQHRRRALFADSEEAFTDAERIVGIATVVLIVGLHAAHLPQPDRRPVPDHLGGLVFTVAKSLIAAAGKLFDFEIGTELRRSLLTVVLFGVGTDYILFLLFRYRERLRAATRPRRPWSTAVDRVGEAIASAAGAVIIAFGAMLLASLGLFHWSRRWRRRRPCCSPRSR